MTELTINKLPVKKAYRALANICKEEKNYYSAEKYRCLHKEAKSRLHRVRAKKFEDELLEFDEKHLKDDMSGPERALKVTKIISGIISEKSKSVYYNSMKNIQQSVRMPKIFFESIHDAAREEGKNFPKVLFECIRDTAKNAGKYSMWR